MPRSSPPAARPNSPTDGRCLECGRPIRPPAQLCRIHAAAQARSVQSLLRQSREIEMQGTVGGSSAAPEWAIIELGVKLAYSIASVADPSARAVYLRVVRNTLVPVLEVDDRHLRIGRSLPLAEHPFMAEAVAAREPRMGSLAATSPGPIAREVAKRIRVDAGVAVPVSQGPLVHGILAIGWRSGKATDKVLASLINIGRLLEFALAAARGLPKQGSEGRRETGRSAR